MSGRPGVGRRRRNRQNNKEDDKCLVQGLFSEKLKGLKLGRTSEPSRAGSPRAAYLAPPRTNGRAGLGAGSARPAGPTAGSHCPEPSSDVSRPPPHPSSTLALLPDTEGGQGTPAVPLGQQGWSAFLGTLRAPAPPGHRSPPGMRRAAPRGRTLTVGAVL